MATREQEQATQLRAVAASEERQLEIPRELLKWLTFYFLDLIDEYPEALELKAALEESQESHRRVCRACMRMADWLEKSREGPRPQ